MKKVIIIGSGLSGISCAHYLDKSKFELQVFEKNSRPGGRVSTEEINGFKCDIGFQVLLNNYEEVKKLNIYNKLDLKHFNSGADIYNKNGNLKLYNPLHHPFKFLRSNIFSIFTIPDILNLLFLFLSRQIDRETAGELFNKKFSAKSQELFFEPFFKGIFLSKELKNDTKFFHKIFKKFALGKASIPITGMSALPNTIIENSNLNIRYNSELVKIKDNVAFFGNGDKHEFDLLVFATPIHNINKVMDMNIPMNYNENKTLYISSSKNVLNKSILLVPNEEFKTNSIQCLSNVSRNYTQSNEHLYSLSSLHSDTKDEILLEEFKIITGIQNNEMKLVKSYSLKTALPESIKKIESKNNIHFSGDWSQEPSIDGAIKSGRLTAKDLNNSFK